MPNFKYTIKDAQGTIMDGTAESDNEELLRKRFTEQGFTVMEVKQIKSTKKTVGGFGKVKPAEIAVMCRQFSTMIDAGVSLVRCLSVLAEQQANPKLKAIMTDVQAEVEAGQTLTSALQKYPLVFDRLFIGLINAGEVGGALEESLQRLSDFMEKDVELKRKVKSAMTYPTLIKCFAVLVVIGLMTFVLPSFMNLFTDLGIEQLPPMTAALKTASDWLCTKWYIALPIVIALVVGYKIFERTKIGRRVTDLIKLKLPVFGTLNHKVAISRFSRTLATLLSSGVGILQALETVAGTVSNEIMSDAIMETAARVREGERIGEPLARSSLFPPMVVQMISIGEESGALDPMLTKIADFYDDEVDAALASLTAALEPVMIVGLGGMVGFIVIAMFSPLIAIIENLSGSGG
ncbi:MAG: type II secretion system F family protein [Abditibacteriota bacterium]|nr:type II secretion system F family protein [Abditibacteriota bacterium]